MNEDDSVNISIYVDDIIISSKDKVICQCVFSRLKKAVGGFSPFTLNINKTAEPSCNLIAFGICLSHKNILLSDSSLERYRESYNNSNDLVKRGIINYIKSINVLQLDALEM